LPIAFLVSAGVIWPVGRIRVIVIWPVHCLTSPLCGRRAVKRHHHHHHPRISSRRMPWNKTSGPSSLCSRPVV